MKKIDEIFHRIELLFFGPIIMAFDCFMSYIEIVNDEQYHHFYLGCFGGLFSVLGLIMCISAIILESLRKIPYITIYDDFINVHIWYLYRGRNYYYSDIESFEEISATGVPYLGIYFKEEAKDKYIDRNIIIRLINHTFIRSDLTFPITMLDCDKEYLITLLQKELEQYNLRTNGNNIE